MCYFSVPGMLLLPHFAWITPTGQTSDLRLSFTHTPPTAFLIGSFVRLLNNTLFFFFKIFINTYLYVCIYICLHICVYSYAFTA